MAEPLGGEDGGGLTLPEPARRTWLAHRDTIREIADDGPPPHRAMLHGGTVLAARWGHRLSVDIDVFLPDHETLTHLWAGSPDDLEVRTGGRIRDSSETQVKIETPTGLIDLAAAPPAMPGWEEAEQVEGRTEITLKDVQILAGKLRRAGQTAARDAVDYVWAAVKNPGALETAVNRHHPDTIEEFADNFRRAGPAIARDARLMEMKAGHVLDADEVGERGAEALRGHVYRGIRIRTEDRRVVVETECRNGRTNTRTHDPDRAATGMNRDGTAAHIATAYGMRRSLLMKAVADAARARGGRTVFDSRTAPKPRRPGSTARP